MGRQNDRRPSSKPAETRARGPVEVDVCVPEPLHLVDREVVHIAPSRGASLSFSTYLHRTCSKTHTVIAVIGHIQMNTGT